MISQELLDKYAPGGRIYDTLVDQYDAFGADRIYTAALEAFAAQDKEIITDALATLKHGPGQSESTVKALLDQLENPLNAPLGSLDNQLLNAAKSLFNSPIVLLLVLGFIFLKVSEFKGALKVWK